MVTRPANQSSVYVTYWENNVLCEEKHMMKTAEQMTAVCNGGVSVKTTVTLTVCTEVGSKPGQCESIIVCWTQRVLLSPAHRR